MRQASSKSIIALDQIDDERSVRNKSDASLMISLFDLRCSYESHAHWRRIPAHTRQVKVPKMLDRWTLRPSLRPVIFIHLFYFILSNLICSFFRGSYCFTRPLIPWCRNIRHGWMNLATIVVSAFSAPRKSMVKRHHPPKFRLSKGLGSRLTLTD